MSFQVGQKVMMKHDRGRWADLALGCVAPEFGVVYTIRDVLGDQETGFLRFNEIKNPIIVTHIGIGEPMFEARMFRPVVERKTDISIFTEILDRETRKQPVCDEIGC